LQVDDDQRRLRIDAAERHEITFPNLQLGNALLGLERGYSPGSRPLLSCFIYSSRPAPPIRSTIVTDP
jgi:hypothetical protein